MGVIAIPIANAPMAGTRTLTISGNMALFYLVLLRGNGRACRGDKFLHVLKSVGRRRTEYDGDNRTRNADIEYDREIPTGKIGEARFPQYETGDRSLGKIRIMHGNADAIRRRKQKIAARRSRKSLQVGFRRVCEKKSEVAGRTVCASERRRNIEAAHVQKVCLREAEFFCEIVHPPERRVIGIRISVFCPQGFSGSFCKYFRAFV